MIQNRQQRRTLERKVQKNARNENFEAIREIMDQGQGQHLIDITIKAIEQFGMPPNASRVAAHHEAGHLVCALSMGGVFAKAYIRADTQGNWGGFSSVHVDGIHCNEPDQTVDVTQEPARAWLLTLIRVSGVAAEMLCRQYHPASSTDEMLLVGGVVVTLANQAGVDPEQVMNVLLGTSMQLIEHNRQAFDELARRLEAAKVLTSEEIANVRVVQIDQAVLMPTGFTLAKGVRGE
jgi:hypothetical protein